ncbi:PIN domain-containing protein [Mesorhizobium marinum]|uniref:PIN domain-containing protein n=1 Tax=Mesorhizobium marinum TaxID=3228790 RepID=A0ABV3QYV3_9HYPH
MIGVDTNVLVRLFTADDAEQHGKALDFFRERSANSPAFVSAVTIAETIRVLRLTYGFSHDEILGVLLTLLETDDFVLDGGEALRAARDADKSALLADFLVALLGRQAGCSHSVTFDQKAAKAVPSMELLA